LAAPNANRVSKLILTPTTYGDHDFIVNGLAMADPPMYAFTGRG